MQEPLVAISLAILKNQKYRFYCPNHSMRIVESSNTQFIKNGKSSGSAEPHKVDAQETQIENPIQVRTLTPSVSLPVVAHVVVSHFNNMIEQQTNIPSPQDENINNELTNN